MSTRHLIVAAALILLVVATLGWNVPGGVNATDDSTAQTMTYRLAVVGIARDAAPPVTAAPEQVPDPEPTAVEAVEPEPAPPADPGWTPGSGPLGRDAIMSMAASVGWPEWTLPTVADIAQCESSGNPGAVSADGQNFGLMQINQVHFGRFNGRDWSNPYDNLSIALEIFYEAGGSFSPWSCYGW
jgi:hypothetical protein